MTDPALLSPPSVSVLVVAYNSREVIVRCLEQIFAAAQHTSIEVLFINNGTDDTAEIVAREFPAARVVPSVGNVGFAAANNLLARNASGEFLLLVNPDLFLEAGAIDALVAGARRLDDGAAWGGVTTTEDGRPDTGNAIPIPSLGEFATAAMGKSMAGVARHQNFDGDARVDVLCGGLVMIASDKWIASNGMDETFFLYCEEVDLFLRLRRQGHALYRVGDARGIHLIAHGSSLSSRRLMYKTAGTMQFIRKHWTAPARLLGAWLIWLAALERWMAGKMLGAWKPRLAELGTAYRDVALRPRLWWYGYDSQKGYKAWLDQQD